MQNNKFPIAFAILLQLKSYKLERQSSQCFLFALQFLLLNLNVFKEVISLVVRKFYSSSIHLCILLHFLFLLYSQANLTSIFFKLIVLYHFNKVIFITQTILFIFVYKRHLECLLSSKY